MKYRKLEPKRKYLGEDVKGYPLHFLDSDEYRYSQLFSTHATLTTSELKK